MSLGKAHRGSADIMGSESGELQEDLQQTDSQILSFLATDFSSKGCLLFYKGGVAVIRLFILK